MVKTGVEKFNTNYIAEVAGVSIGTLYQYFKNKENIIEILFINELDKNIERLDTFIEEKGSELTLDEFIHEIVRMHVVDWGKKKDLGVLLLKYANKFFNIERMRKVDDHYIPKLKEKVVERGFDINTEDIDYALVLAMQLVRSVVFFGYTAYEDLDKDKMIKETSIMISSYLKGR